MAGGSARFSLRRDPDGGLGIVLGGSWRVASGVANDTELRTALASGPAAMRFDASAVEDWDSTLVAFVAGMLALARAQAVPVDRGGLPAGVQRLIDLAEAAPVRAAPPEEGRPPFLARVGIGAVRAARSGIRVLAFVGEAAHAFALLLAGRARFRRRELFLLIQVAGAQAFGIVSLVAFLVGLILAFVGAVQLQVFGAAIYIADLVGISMVRELAAVMAGIVVAGRTGAAYAAELGTMRVTQEMDALSTLGISPMQFLVAPRIAALTLMLPFLCLYADLLGVLGGAVVGVGMMGIGAHVYYVQTLERLTLADFLGGVFKAAVYGALVAGAGCFEGMRSGRSASAVGRAATAAVVNGIVLVIAACGLFAALFYAIGI